VRASALALVALVLPVACTVGPDYRRPKVPVPTEFRGAAPEAPKTAESLGDLAWWKVFEDQALQGLIRDALQENYDLRIAASRILGARAQVTIARSFQYPVVTGGSSAAYTRLEGDRGPAPSLPKEEFRGIGGVDVSFEIDFWGRWRRTTEAARAELLASEGARRVVQTTLVSDVATGYFTLRDLDLELEISRRTLASRQHALRLVRLRQEGGVAGMLDVRQAEVLVQTAAEAIPDLERRIEQTENQISVLLGRSPGPIPRDRPLAQQLTLPAVPAGLPSSLLERRPDIQQAESQLAAATARIGVAKSDYFPRVFLTGAASVAGTGTSGVTAIGGGTSGWSWIGPSGLFGVGPQVTVPIFNSGRIGAGVDAAEAQAEEALVRYQQTIQQAFREVSDSLVEYRKRQEFRVQQEALVAALRDAVRLSNIRYRGGVTSYLEVLDSERQLFDNELLFVQSLRDELLAVVRLYKAVGGGWQE
jgi:multidrug efflux system outer membrane protein